MARLAALFAPKTTTETVLRDYGSQTVVTVLTWYGRTLSREVATHIRKPRLAAARFGH